MAKELALLTEEFQSSKKKNGAFYSRTRGSSGIKSDHRSTKLLMLGEERLEQVSTRSSASRKNLMHR